MITSSLVNRKQLFSKKDSVLITLSANQTSNLITGNHVEFDTIISGSMPLTTGVGQSNGKITLKANNRYKLIAGSVPVFSSATGYVFLRWYDYTNSAYIASGVYGYQSGSALLNSENTPITEIIPLTDIQVVLKIESFNLSNFQGGFSSNPQTWAQIEQIDSVSSVNQNVIGSGSYKKDKLITVAGQYIYSLTYAPISDSENVTFDGVGLTETDDYTISGNILTLNGGYTIFNGQKLTITYAF